MSVASTKTVVKRKNKEKRTSIFSEVGKRKMKEISVVGPRFLFAIRVNRNSNKKKEPRLAQIGVFDDETLKINWKIKNPIVSNKDNNLPNFE